MSEASDETKAKIAALLGRIHGGPLPRLQEGSRLVEDLGFQSIQIVRVFSEIQREFGIKLGPDDFVFENVSAVGSIARLVDAHRKGR